MSWLVERRTYVNGACATQGLRVRNIARDIERFLRSNKELEDDVIEDVT